MPKRGIAAAPADESHYVMVEGRKIMENRITASLPGLCSAVVFILVTLCPASSTCYGTDDFQVLARVEVPGYLQDLNLPVHAALTDGDGVQYALVIAPLGTLQAAGVSFRVLDEYYPGTRYLLAKGRKPESREKAAQLIGVLYDDGRWIIVRYTKETDETLLHSGFNLKLMSDTPIILTALNMSLGMSPAGGDSTGGKSVITAIPSVTAMMGAVTENSFRSYISGLSGASPVTVDGGSYTITTRNTESGTPVTKATRYVYEQLGAMSGMTASFYSWSDGDYSNRNVVGELTGVGKPDEIIIFIAHLDSINEGTSPAIAPGADDDASGCSALLTAASIMSTYTFQRTIRFVFATGEEQGLLGSAAYARSLGSQNIVAVVNLDMIAFNTPITNPTQRVKIRKASDPGYPADLAIANVFKDVVDSYGLGGSLQVIITPDGEADSDQSSFWDKGFAAAWVIEDDYDDFDENYYHTKNDTLATLDTAYGTAQVKASLGTVAYLAGPPGGSTVTTTIITGTTTSTAYTHTTTTITVNGRCPAENVLGPESSQLDSLRALRDSRLARSAAGRRITSIYYNNAGSINAALERCPALQAAARWLLETIASLPGREDE